ncbi:MAG: Holliday junction resolvase RuvX [Myxococcota bacterium]
MLGIDPGERRIGVAVSDPQGVFAQPLETLETRGLQSRKTLAKLHEIAKTYAVERIVVGLPRHMDGREGPEAERVRSFAARLTQLSNLEVELIDERWTSLEARRLLRDSGVRARKQRGRIDRIAASLLLQTWLDRRGP